MVYPISAIKGKIVNISIEMLLYLEQYRINVVRVHTSTCDANKRILMWFIFFIRYQKLFIPQDIQASSIENIIAHFK